MVKGQEVKKNKKAPIKTSRNAKKKSIEVSTLSSEELLEQILNKKKEKQVKKSASVSNAKKTTVKKTTKKTVKKETVDSSLLLDQILEKNKAKKQRKVERKSKKTSGRLLVDTNTVENKIVQEIIKLQEEEQKKKEESLIITKEINLEEYLKEQNELPARKDFLELEEELYPTPKSKKDKVKEKIETIKQDRKEKRAAKYEKEIEEKLERRKQKSQKVEKVKVKKQPRKPKEKVKIEYKYSRSILPGILIASTCILLVVCASILLLTKTTNAVKTEEAEEIDVSANLDLGAVKAMQEVCLNEGFNSNDYSVELAQYISELNTALNGYNASVYYYDFGRGFTYTYKENDSYYAASLVKLIPALYIYEKANNGELDLDKTVTYTSGYNYTDSAYFDTARYGTKVSLRNLVKYSLIYSDNSAYMMLLDYIGRNTLKEYGRSLGVSNYMDTDNFGHIKAVEAIGVIKRLYSLLSVGSATTNELKSYLVDSDKNYLKLEGINAATKYGETYPNFHEYGIVFDEQPYGIVILTKDMGKDYENEIKAINQKIYEIHKKFYQNRTDNCSMIAK